MAADATQKPRKRRAARSAPNGRRVVGSRRLQLYFDGRRLRLVAWKTRRAVYWISNTLSQSLNQRQMLAIAESLTRLKQ